MLAARPVSYATDKVKLRYNKPRCNKVRFATNYLFGSLRFARSINENRVVQVLYRIGELSTTIELILT